MQSSQSRSHHRCLLFSSPPCSHLLFPLASNVSNHVGAVFCLAAALALDRDRRSATSVAVVACNSTATDDIACGTAGPRSEYDYRECGDGNFSKSYVGRSGTEGCESVADESGGGHSNRNSSNGVGNLGNGSPASDAINVPLLNERARPVNGRTSLGAR